MGRDIFKAILSLMESGRTVHRKWGLHTVPKLVSN